jgi:hypothetical protein
LSISNDWKSLTARNQHPTSYHITSLSSKWTSKSTSFLKHWSENIIIVFIVSSFTKFFSQAKQDTFFQAQTFGLKSCFVESREGHAKCSFLDLFQARSYVENAKKASKLSVVIVLDSSFQNLKKDLSVS